MMTNKYNLPQQIAAAVARRTYKKTADISVTGLILPPRIYQLKQRHEAEIIEDVSDRLWSFFGTVAHKVLEHTDDTGAFHEENLIVTVRNWTVSGRTDTYCTQQLIDYPTAANPVYEQIPPTIRDYKNIAVGGQKFDHPDWEEQLNLNAHLWREHGFAVDKLEVIMLFRDWKKLDKERDHNYPPPVLVQDIPMWSHEKTTRFIEGKVGEHQVAESLTDDMLPLCTPEDQWRRTAKWAVMSFKNIRAVKVCNSEKEAYQLIESKQTWKSTHYVEFRPAEPIRCNHFCEVKDFCSQYAIEKRQEDRRKNERLQESNKEEAAA